jgi:phosphatidylglycerophosphatase A
VERAIDIIKVPPAPWIERRVPGGWGVVLDDVVAGAYTQLLLRAVLLIHPALLGV